MRITGMWLQNQKSLQTVVAKNDKPHKNWSPTLVQVHDGVGKEWLAGSSK